MRPTAVHLSWVLQVCGPKPEKWLMGTHPHQAWFISWICSHAGPVHFLLWKRNRNSTEGLWGTLYQEGRKEDFKNIIHDTNPRCTVEWIQGEIVMGIDDLLQPGWACYLHYSVKILRLITTESTRCLFPKLHRDKIFSCAGCVSFYGNV